MEIYALKSYPIFGVETRVNDPVHVEIEIVKFQFVRVWLAGIDRNFDAIDFNRFFFDHILHHQRILLR